MSRKQFIESHGATCDNWTWSWSFVNHDERFVIFGAWEHLTKGGLSVILDEDWLVRRDTGKKNAGYKQSREHVRLVVEEGYDLRIFFMRESHHQKGEANSGPAKIEDFDRTLHTRTIKHIGSRWYACEDSPGMEFDMAIPEEIDKPEVYPEGALKSLTVNAFERNGKAKRKCLDHYGFSCIACGFDFFRTYGSLGAEYIHVHHVKPLSEIGEQYEVDPIKDLVPICPNCHSMIHRYRPALSIEELERILVEQRNTKTG